MGCGKSGDAVTRDLGINIVRRCSIRSPVPMPIQIGLCLVVRAARRLAGEGQGLSFNTKGRGPTFDRDMDVRWDRAAEQFAGNHQFNRSPAGRLAC